MILVCVCLSIGCAGSRVGASVPVGGAHVGFSVPVFFWNRERIQRYPTIFEAAEQGDVTDLKTHLLKGAIVNSKDSEGKTALHYAAAGGYERAVRYLISQGGNVNSEDNDGMTPLQRAKSSGHYDVVERLEKHGAK